MKKYFSFLSLCFILCLILINATSKEKKQTDDKKKKPIEVFIDKVKTQDIFDSLVFGGFIEAKKSFEVSTEISGTILDMFIVPGDKVKKGQKLFSLKPISTGYEFKAHNVNSPISGTISEVKEKTGQILKAGTPVLIVSDITGLLATIDVTYGDLPFINNKTNIDVIIAEDSPNKKQITAKVNYISPQANPLTGTYAVNLTLNCKSYSGNCHKDFPLGALIKVVIKKNLRKGIKIPLSYLHHQRTKVLLMDKKNKAKWIKVKLGTLYGKDVEITEGLKEGMTVIKSFAKRPEDGDLLKVSSKEDFMISKSKDKTSNKTQ